MRKTIVTTALLSMVSAMTVYAALPPEPATHVVRNPAPQTRAEAIVRARAEFAALDTNKDGFVTRDELPKIPEGTAIPAAGGAADRGRAGAPDRLFALMDKNGDGSISRAEFDAFYGKGGVSQQTTVTQSDDGKEMRQEHVVVMHASGVDPMPLMPLAEPGRIAGLMFAMRFDRIDSDHDGKVSAAEAEAAAAQRFDRLDTNHDGILTAEERSAGMPRIVTRTIRLDAPDAPKPAIDK